MLWHTGAKNADFIVTSDASGSWDAEPSGKRQPCTPAAVPPTVTDNHSSENHLDVHSLDQAVNHYFTLAPSASTTRYTKQQTTGTPSFARISPWLLSQHQKVLYATLLHVWHSKGLFIVPIKRIYPKCAKCRSRGPWSESYALATSGTQKNLQGNRERLPELGSPGIYFEKWKLLGFSLKSHTS